jgi:hypothetical protein
MSSSRTQEVAFGLFNIEHVSMFMGFQMIRVVRIDLTSLTHGATGQPQLAVTSLVE